MYVISALCSSNPQRRTTKWGSEHQQWDIVWLDSSEIISNGHDILSYSLERLNRRYKKGSISIARQPVHRWDREYHSNKNGQDVRGEWKALYEIPLLSGIGLLLLVS